MSDSDAKVPDAAQKAWRLTPKDPSRLTGKITAATLPKFDESVVRPAYLAHVVLNTSNMEGMSAWWRTAKGVEVMGPNDKTMEMNADFITFDREHHRIALSNVRPASREPSNTAEAGPAAAQSAASEAHALQNRTPLNHIAFTYATAADLVATYTRLKKLAIVPVRTIHHGPTISNYYNDPDGNRVELQIDAFESLEALDAWFKTGQFDRNPIGVTFNFDTFVARVQAGDEERFLRSPDGFIQKYADDKQ